MGAPTGRRSGRAAIFALIAVLALMTAAGLGFGWARARRALEQERARTGQPPAPVQAPARPAEAALWRDGGRLAVCARRVARCEELLRSAPDDTVRLVLACNLGIIADSARMAGDHARASAALRRGLEQLTGGPEVELPRGLLLARLGRVHLEAGALAEASRPLEEAIGLLRTHRERGPEARAQLVLALGSWAELALLEGQARAASEADLTLPAELAQRAREAWREQYDCLRRGFLSGTPGLLARARARRGEARVLLASQRKAEASAELDAARALLEPLYREVRPDPDVILALIDIYTLHRRAGAADLLGLGTSRIDALHDWLVVLRPGPVSELRRLEWLRAATEFLVGYGSNSDRSWAVDVLERARRHADEALETWPQELRLHRERARILLLLAQGQSGLDRRFLMADPLDTAREAVARWGWLVDQGPPGERDLLEAIEAAAYLSRSLSGQSAGSRSVELEEEAVRAQEEAVRYARLLVAVHGSGHVRVLANTLTSLAYAQGRDPFAFLVAGEEALALQRAVAGPVNVLQLDRFERMVETTRQRVDEVLLVAGELPPGTPEARRYLAHHLLRLGEPVRASALFAEVLAEGPPRAQDHLAAARAAARAHGAGEVAEAVVLERLRGLKEALGRVPGGALRWAHEAASEEFAGLWERPAFADLRAGDAEE